MQIAWQVFITHEVYDVTNIHVLWTFMELAFTRTDQSLLPLRRTQDLLGWLFLGSTLAAAYCYKNVYDSLQFIS